MLSIVPRSMLRNLIDGHRLDGGYNCTIDVIPTSYSGTVRLKNCTAVDEPKRPYHEAHALYQGWQTGTD